MAPLGFLSTLPAVSSVQQCASYELTVAPFLPQLRGLPKAVLDASSSSSPFYELWDLYLATNPIVLNVALILVLAPIFLIVSEINKNYSQVDRFWSLLPTVFNSTYVVWAHSNGLPTARLDLLLLVSIIWSARLTFNYWRRGGYEVGSEDYRWNIIRGWGPDWVFFIFNVVFISFLQLVLLALVTTPTYVLMLVTLVKGDTGGIGNTGLGVTDLLFASLMVGLVAVSWLADQQQWDYQSAKYHFINHKKLPKGANYALASIKRGFNTHGLWAFSRHPNFCAEQAVWVTLYQWSVFATVSAYNWTGLGALFYLALFQGSTWLTERITASKYKEYATYQERVSMFLPKPISPWTEPVPRTAEEKKLAQKSS